VRPLALALGIAAAAAVGGPRLAGAQGNGEASFLGATLERDALIEAVLVRNPSIEAARQAWQAALHRVPQARSLDDPRVSYGLGPLSVGSGERFGQVIEVAQHFPAAGTLRLRAEVARAEADVARHEHAGARLALAHLAALLFSDYYLVHRAIEINGEQLALLEDFKRIATAQYASGTAAQQDPLQAEVEVAHLLHRRVTLESARQVAAAQINALLHRRPELPLPPPPRGLAVPDSDPPAAAALQELAVRGRPELGAAAAATRARAAGVELSERGFRPDFELMGSFNSMWDMNAHRFMVGVGVRLPIRRGRVRAAVAESEALLAQARSEELSLEDEVRSEVLQAHTRLLEAHHVVQLHLDRLLPTARDQVQAALAGFRSGQNSFLALIEAERNQRTTRLGLEEALAGQDRARADLDRALGRAPGSDVPADELPAEAGGQEVE
jgi:outer membrane protein TolC